MRFKSQQQLEEWIKRAKGAASASVHTAGTVATQTNTVPVDPAIQRRILGVDTALRCTGWGMIDVRGNNMKAVDCGVIKNPPQDKVSGCLRCLAGGIREIIQLYHPDIAVLEGAFYFANVRTAMILGSARGAVISVLAENNIPVYEYAPRRIKQAVCGNGNASKEQVAIMVANYLGIKTDALALDSTDALSMAICHAYELTTAGGLSLPPEV